jgi:hypothetical protein
VRALRDSIEPGDLLDPRTVTGADLLLAAGTDSPEGRVFHDAAAHRRAGVRSCGGTAACKGRASDPILHRFRELEPRRVRPVV